MESTLLQQISSSSAGSDRTLLQRIESEIKREQTALTDRLVSGGPEKHDRIAGRIEGLGDAYNTVSKIIRAWHLDDEEAA